MKPRTQEQLENFHQAVMNRSRDSVIPEPLKVNSDSEFRAYLGGQEGSWYYRWLRSAVEEFEPKNILELGTNTGASAIALYSAKASYCDLVTVDIQDVARCLPEEMFKHPNFCQVIADDVAPGVVESTIGTANPMLVKRFHGSVDFLFIDTDHRADHLRKELDIYLKWLAPGALVVLDDININDMREVWDSLPFVKLDISEDCHYSGFGMFVWEPA